MAANVAYALAAWAAGFAIGYQVKLIWDAVYAA